MSEEPKASIKSELQIDPQLTAGFESDLEYKIEKNWESEEDGTTNATADDNVAKVKIEQGDDGYMNIDSTESGTGISQYEVKTEQDDCHGYSSQYGYTYTDSGAAVVKIEHESIQTGEKPYSCNNQTASSDNYTAGIVKIETGFEEEQAKTNNSSVYNCGRPTSFKMDSTSGKFDKNDTSATTSGESSAIQWPTCEICRMKFSTEAILTKHMYTHTGGEIYTCNFCKKSFSKYFDFLGHERIHTGEKPYSCITCKKSFARISCLRQHEQVHIENPFRPTCNICKKSFSERRNLLVHTRRIHKGEKPYPCNICEKAFYTSSALNKHVISHT